MFVVEATKTELRELTRLTTGTHYNYSKKRDDIATYFHNLSTIPAGFWASIMSLNKKGYTVIIENYNEFRNHIRKEDFVAWLDEQDLNFDPYEYQTKGVHIAINFRHLRLLLDTSAGKSYLIYLYCLYLKQNLLRANTKILILVPRTLLVRQLPKDFKEYSSSDEIICDELMGDNGVEREGSNVVVGNITTVAKKPVSWFQQFGAIVIDEAHKIGNASTQNVMNAMFQNPNCDYILSMSGTFEEVDNGATERNEFKAVTEMAYLGAILQKLYVEDLRKFNTIADADVKIFKFNADYELCKSYYNHPDCVDEGGRFLFESSYIQGIERYRYLINAIASDAEFNQVLLFNSKKFLRLMALECEKYLKEKNIKKRVYVIDGDVKTDDRDVIIKELNTRNDGILFAMYEILSTGVSVKSLNGIHLVDSTKSLTRVRQSIGRVLRLHPSKTKALIYDYPVIFYKYDEENWTGGRRNSYDKHSEERKHIYRKRQFDVKTYTIPLSGRSSFLDEIPRVDRPKKAKHKPIKFI